MAQRIVYSGTGGPEVLRLVDEDPPAPAAGEVRIRVEAAGVNPIDWKLRSGLRPFADGEGARGVGTDGAGVVVEAGSAVEGLLPGRSVVFWGAAGSYASEVNVPATRVLPRPPHVSAKEGAALGVPAGTAYQSLRSLGVGQGDIVLVHGGSGAVGQLAVQFAVLWGADVIATASESRHDRLRELGATPVAYGPGLAERVRAASPGVITAAFDAAGTDEAILTSLELVDDRSRIATIVRGADAARLGIRAFSGGSPEPLSPVQREWRAEAVPVAVALLAASALSVELGPSFPLQRAHEAHRAGEAGERGKITVTPGG